MGNTHYSCCAHAHPAHSWVRYCRDDNCTAAFIAFGVAMVIHACLHIHVHVYMLHTLYHRYLTSRNGSVRLSIYDCTLYNIV